MIGISGFGAEQVHVARQNPPSLKAIFPFDPRGAYGTLGGFREEYPGGVVHLFRYLVGHFGVFHQDRGAPGELPPEKEALWREAMEDPDYRMYPHVHNVVSMKGQHMPAWFEMLIDPFEQPGTVERSEEEFEPNPDPDLHGIGLVRLHVQDAPPGRADLLAAPARRRQEAAVPRPRAPRAAVPRAAPRDPALVRPLAEGHRHRRPRRAAGPLLGQRRERVAHRHGLAAARDAVDEALPVELGAPAHRALHAGVGRRPRPARLVRPDAALADARRRGPAVPQRPAPARRPRRRRRPC